MRTPESILPEPRLSVGYCTNVHPGVDLATIRENLERYAVDVRHTLSDGGALGIGLWLPKTAVDELLDAGDAAIGEFASWLSKKHLRVFTINGFPYDNFHQPVVKHRVYLPTWWQPERLLYTQQLAEILVQLLPDDEPFGSISTLPIGWRSQNVSKSDLDTAGANFRELASSLEALERRTGRRIVVAIEPEPGCLIDTTEDCVRWFAEQLPEAMHRRYVTVCHDICHSAVMMEPQQHVLRRYAEQGIRIGKVQVSSAIVADWQSMALPRRQEAITQLKSFAEDRYLHQTGRLDRDGKFVLEEDLPALIDHVEARSQSVDTSQVANRLSFDCVDGDDRWVVHFHVPIFLERFGHLTTSHAEVLECLRTLLGESTSTMSRALDFTGHLEVETYAWSVLPEAMRRRGLAEDIANEIRWLRRTIVEAM